MSHVTGNRYTIRELLARGDFADVFLADCVTAEGHHGLAVMKESLSPGDNDVLLDESRCLPLLDHVNIPKLVETFLTPDDRVVNVIPFVDGFDGVSLRERFPQGMDQYHVCWIFERLLNALAHAHGQHILHGNIEPGNYIVMPKKRVVYLIDWTLAVNATGDAAIRFKAYNPQFSAREVQDRQAPTTASDMWSLAMSMIHLLGGTGMQIPAEVDPRLSVFLYKFLKTDPELRMRDAAAAWFELHALREEIFGKESFAELTI